MLSVVSQNEQFSGFTLTCNLFLFDSSRFQQTPNFAYAIDKRVSFNWLDIFALFLICSPPYSLTMSTIRKGRRTRRGSMGMKEKRKRKKKEKRKMNKEGKKKNLSKKKMKKRKEKKEGEEEK